jgi:hypothetical protein
VPLEQAGVFYVEFVPKERGVVHALAKATQDGGCAWSALWLALPTGGSDARAELEQEVQRLAALDRPGLPGHRGRPQPPLTVEQILAWADAHKARTGDWPSAVSGAVAEAPEENWKALNQALWRGRRGLPGRDSLARLLRRERGARDRRGRSPDLTRRSRAVRLRGKGLTLRQVGKRLGITPQAVCDMLRRVRREGEA